ncbi:MAG: YetF domain-containing protein, partial [Cyanobacteria bacterium J06638_6]
ILDQNLNEELISKDEFRTVLRRQGFEDLAEIKAAILETSGSITVERAADLPTPVETELLQRLANIEQRLQGLQAS